MYVSHFIFTDVYIIYQSKVSIILIIIILKIHIFLPSNFHQGSFTHTGLYQIIKGHSLTCERKHRAVVLQEGGWSTPRPGRSTPGKNDRYPMYRRMCPIICLDGQGEEEIFCPTCVRAAVRPAQGETLYGLCYSSPRQSFKFN